MAKRELNACQDGRMGIKCAYLVRTREHVEAREPILDTQWWQFELKSACAPQRTGAHEYGNT